MQYLLDLNEFKNASEDKKKEAQDKLDAHKKAGTKIDENLHLKLKKYQEERIKEFCAEIEE